VSGCCRERLVAPVEALVDALVSRALALPLGAQRWVGVVVHAGARELAGVATDVDGEAGLGRQIGTTPSEHVVFKCSRAAVIGDGAVLQRDAAAVREKQLVERDQVVAAAVDVRAAGGLADVGVGLKGRNCGFNVACR
jgi:hypothetical protein